MRDYRIKTKVYDNAGWLIEKSEYYKVSNLHVHSNYSDGEDDFLNLIESAKNLGLKNFAITDHNSVEFISKIISFFS